MAGCRGSTCKDKNWESLKVLVGDTTTGKSNGYAGSTWTVITQAGSETVAASTDIKTLMHLGMAREIEVDAKRGVLRLRLDDSVMTP